MRACLVSSLMKSGSELRGLYSLGCRETELCCPSHDDCDDDDDGDLLVGLNMIIILTTSWRSARMH